MTTDVDPAESIADYIVRTTVETPAPAADPTPPARVAGVGLVRRLQLAEPVRLYLYSVLTAVLPLLVAAGLLTDVVSPLWEALGAAVLGVGGVAVTERLRANVVSPRTAVQEQMRAVAAVLGSREGQS